MVERLPPYSEEAEKAVLGAGLIDPEQLAGLAATLAPEDFYLERHRTIFACMLELERSGLDFVTLTDTLEQRGQLEKVGGRAAVQLLLDQLPAAIHAEHYARLVSDYAVRRRVQDLCLKTYKAAWPSAGLSCEELLSEANRGLMEITARRLAGGAVTAGQAASALYDQVEYWAQHPLAYGEVRGLSTGIPSLDSLTGGLRPGTLVLIAARPSVGKSGLAFEMARRVARRGGRVLIFSLEMTAEEIMARWASAISGVPSDRLERGLCPQEQRGSKAGAYYASEEDLEAYAQALVEITEYRHVVVDARAGLTAAQIRATALMHARKLDGLDLVILDHTGLIHEERGDRRDHAAKREGRKSQAMKELAKEVGAPVVLVQQLSRTTEIRHNKRPVLSDLRDSGEHEQNADIVVGLYCEACYETGTPPGDRKREELALLCLKHRNGAAQTQVIVRYEREISRFSEWGEGGAEA
jgi:replicative DNA helicase